MVLEKWSDLENIRISEVFGRTGTGALDTSFPAFASRMPTHYRTERKPARFSGYLVYCLGLRLKLRQFALSSLWKYFRLFRPPYIDGKNREPCYDGICDNPGFPFPAFDGGVRVAREKWSRNLVSKLLQVFCRSILLQTLRVAGYVRSVQAGQKPFQIPLYLRGRRKKFPNANPKAESSPNHFDFPVISYYFPPFSVSKLLGNVGRQITRACPSRGSVGIFPAPPVFLRRRRRFFLSEPQGFCSPIGTLKIRGASEAKRRFYGASRFIGKKLPFARRKKRAARIRNRLSFFSCCA